MYSGQRCIFLLTVIQMQVVLMGLVGSGLLVPLDIHINQIFKEYNYTNERCILLFIRHTNAGCFNGYIFIRLVCYVGMYVRRSCLFHWCILVKAVSLDIYTDQRYLCNLAMVRSLCFERKHILMMVACFTGYIFWSGLSVSLIYIPTYQHRFIEFVLI